MTATSIEQGYQIFLSIIHEYERTAEKPTLDGFTTWLVRRQAYELEQYKKHLEQRVKSQALRDVTQ